MINRPIPENIEEYKRIFWSNVYRTGKSDEECHLWAGKIRRKSDGRITTPLFRIGEFKYLTSRLAYYFTHNIDPLDSLTCHSCNNPSCCNPVHLYLGTSGENTRDAWRDGLCENSRHCKLTEEIVKEIKRLKRLGTENWYIAETLKINKNTISSIVNGRSWVHVE